VSVSAYKRLTIVLGAVCVGLLVLYGCLYWSYGWLKVRVAFASEQTQIFEEMRTRALQSDVAGAAGCLEYVVRYYPSGSNQETGSRLDGMVERERTIAIREMLPIFARRPVKIWEIAPRFGFKGMPRNKGAELGRY